jgi:hypothetical protein
LGVAGYFPQYSSPDFYFTYSWSEDNITFTSHFQNEMYSETFQYVLSGNHLLIKGFSNPFSVTAEARSDVNFTKVE